MSKLNLISTVSAIHLFYYILLVNGEVQDTNYSEEAARAYLKKIDKDIQLKTTENVLASWAYESNITDENLKYQLEVSAQFANFTKEIWKETIKFPWKTFQDPDIRRQFQKFSVLGTPILSPEKYERLNKIISDMHSIYGKAKICNYFNRTNCTLQLEPEITEIFMKSRNPDELRYYWEEWRNAAGRPTRQMYKEYVDLANEAAVLNNFTNNAEFWLKDYEAPDFKEQVEDLWEQLRPLYLQLHAYVRRRLRERYGEKYVTKQGPIPAHLLGNMWAQSWGNIFEFTAPYPGKPSTDVTPNMVEQGYTPQRMFKLAEQFFTSLNLSPMPESFWKNSILEKPNDGRDLICHASAWDFYDGKDFRIKQCTRVTMEDLNTVHHEMGHIQYFLQYKNQPVVYKEGSNPGFHEAVGDVMALSVSTPNHLRKIGLLNAVDDDAESEINQLFSMALEKIAFVPFGYLMDQWRWKVFEGEITEGDYNCKWWQLREKYQGLSPSVVRSEEDFDPGAKYHIVANVPYIRYFVSFVIQFQFHRSLCVAAKEYDPNNPASKPLHKCDIYKSKEAGALLQEMLQMGSSKPWPDAMEVITGQRKMDARALLEYFATLKDWLEKENKRTNEFIGWENSQKACQMEISSEDETTSITSPGKFEDDNIAYSYAEFVRQDDNAFGVADYTEESEPSYFVLPHRSKKNSLRGYTLLLKNADHVNENENFYIPGNSQLQLDSAFEGSFRRQDKKEVRLTPSKMFDERHQCPYCQTDSNSWPITAFDLETKSQKIKNSEGSLQKMSSLQREELFTRAEKNVRPLDEKKFKSFKKSTLIEKQEISGENPDNSGNGKDSTNDERKAMETLVNSKYNDHKSNLKYILQEGINNEDSEKRLGGLKLCKFTDGNPQFPSNAAIETLKKYGNLNLKPNNELIQKAEAVKTEAIEMLKSLNNSDSGTPDFSVDLENKMAVKFPDNRSFYSNTLPKFTRAKSNEMDRISLLRALLKQNYQKNNGMAKNDLLEHSPKKGVNGPRQETHDKDRESDVQISNRLYRKKLKKVQNTHDDQRNVHKKNENGDSYVMFIRKLSGNDEFEEGKRRLQKKSYREFSSGIKSPVVYNAVVITTNGKNDKMDDTKALSPRINSGMSSGLRRQGNFQTVKFSRKKYADTSQVKREIYQNILRNRFYKPGSSYQYNIINRLQYLHATQRLTKESIICD